MSSQETEENHTFQQVFSEDFERFSQSLGPDPPFDPSFAHSQVGEKIESLTPELLKLSGDLYAHMYGQTPIEILKATNYQIIRHNIKNQLLPQNLHWVKPMSITETYNFLGLALLLHLEKTPTTKTRTFIRGRYKRREQSLFEELQLCIKTCNVISYSRFLSINVFFHIGRSFRYIPKQKW